MRGRLALRDMVRDSRCATGTKGVAVDWTAWAAAATGRDVRERMLSSWVPVLPPLQLVDGYIRTVQIALWSGTGATSPMSHCSGA